MGKGVKEVRGNERSESETSVEKQRKREKIMREDITEVGGNQGRGSRKSEGKREEREEGK